MIYNTRGTPTETDPLGAEGIGEPTTLPVAAARPAAGGGFDVVILSFGTRTEIKAVPEGSEPGQVQERSRLPRRRSREMMAALRQLAQSGPVPVRLVLNVAQAKRGRRAVRPVAEDLLRVAESDAADTLDRALAAHLLADLLLEDTE